MRHKDIKYRIYKFTTREEEGQLIRRKLGFLSNDGVTKNKDEARVYTYEELSNLFGMGLQDVIDFKNEEYEIDYECTELDNMFNEIKSLTKDAFVRGDNVVINDVLISLDYNDDVISPLTNKKYEKKRFIIWCIIDSKIILSDCGGDIPYSALFEFVEKLRRHYEYDDPYKHKVEDKSLLDSIWDELGNKEELED